MVGGHHRQGGEWPDPWNSLTTTHLRFPAKRLALSQQRLIDFSDGLLALFNQGIHIGLQAAQVGQTLFHPEDTLHQCRAAL